MKIFCPSLTRWKSIITDTFLSIGIENCWLYSILKESHRYRPWRLDQRYYIPRCSTWPRSGGTIYIGHHFFLGIEVLPSSQLSMVSVSMATRVSRPYWVTEKDGSMIQLPMVSPRASKKKCNQSGPYPTGSHIEYIAFEPRGYTVIRNTNFLN